MKQTNYSVYPFWDFTAVDKLTKQSRIMMTVNLQGIRPFRITLKNVRSTKLNFEKAMSSSAKGLSEEAIQIRKDWNENWEKAASILKHLSVPTKEMFLQLYKSGCDLSHNNKISIVPFFEAKISRLFDEGRFATSDAYNSAITSFTKFKPVICFEDVDKKFILSFKSWMLSKGNSAVTATIYLATLRSIYNDAMNDKIIPATCYPFKGVGLTTHVKSKAVLYPKQLEELLNYKCIDEIESNAVAYFFFSYLSSGINFYDIAHLKFKNISQDILTFCRHKTGKEIRVYIHDNTKDIIKRWGNLETEVYIFPILNDTMSAFVKHQEIARHKRVVNKALGRIGTELGFGKLYVGMARHSFATKQKLAGVPISFIGEALGHSSTTTTEHYMKSLPNENLKVMSSNLLTF